MATEPTGVEGPLSPCGMTGTTPEVQPAPFTVLSEITTAFVAIARTFEATAVRQVQVAAKDMAAAAIDPAAMNAMLALCRLQCESAERLKLAVARLEALCAAAKSGTP